jgi:hypothetical protein
VDLSAIELGALGKGIAQEIGSGEASLKETRVCGIVTRGTPPMAIAA